MSSSLTLLAHAAHTLPSAGDIPHENVPKWNVTVLPVSKAQRYKDPGVAQKFWGALDNFIYVQRPWLLPKGVSAVAGAGSAPAATPISSR